MTLEIDLRPADASDHRSTRLTWLTDIHLDFVRGKARVSLEDEIAAGRPDGVVIAGDIATASDVFVVLDEIVRAIHVPVWFVLGNHDFYHGSIADVRARAEAGNALGGAQWLETAGALRIGPRTALVGVNGWGDGRLGDYAGSRVVLNDFVLIDELAGLNRQTLRARLADLGDAAAAVLRTALTGVLTWAEHLVVATHVPPFREACWHEGSVSADDWLPFFTCAATGEVLRAAAVANPKARFTVLCGHTHSEGVAQVLPNLQVLTGGARYGEPRTQSVLLV